MIAVLHGYSLNLARRKGRAFFAATAKPSRAAFSSRLGWPLHGGRLCERAINLGSSIRAEDVHGMGHKNANAENDESTHYRRKHVHFPAPI